ATSLGLRLTDSTGALKAETVMPLAVPTQPTSTVSSGAMVLPAEIHTTPGVWAPLVLSNAAFSGAGTLSVDVFAPAARLQWSGGNTPAAGITVTSGQSFTKTADATVYTATRFSGSAEALNAFFSTAGAVRYDTGFDGELRIALLGTMPVTGSILITTLAAEGSVSGPATMALRLPQALTITPNTSSPLVIGAALSGDAAEGTYALTLTAATGTLTANSASSLTVSTVTQGVRLSGTITALNTYLGSGHLTYQGAGNVALSASLTLGAKALLSASSQLVAAIAAQPALTVAQTQYVVPGTASPVTLGADPLAGVGQLTLLLEAASGSVLEAVDGGLTDSLADAHRVQLVGSAATLNAYLASGFVRYTGSAGSMKATLTSTDGKRSAEASVALTGVTLTETSQLPVLGLSLPQSLATTPALASALVLLGSPLQLVSGTVSGAYTLSLAVGAGSLTARDTALDSLPSSDASGATLALTGTLTELNSYLGSGHLIYTGSGTALTVVLQKGTQFAQGSVQLQASSAATSPYMSVPAYLPISTNVASALDFGPSALGTTSAATKLILSVATGSLAVNNPPAEGVQLAGGGTTSLTLTGSASVLNTLMDDGSIRFTGAGSQTLTVRIEDAASSTRYVETVVDLVDISTPVAPPAIVSVSRGVNITGGTTSDLVFSTLDFSGTGNLTLTLAITSGSLSVNLTGTSGITASGQNTQQLSLAGTAEGLENLLKTFDKVFYTGEGSALTMTLAQTSDSTRKAAVVISLDVTAVASADVQTLAPMMTLPVSVAAFPGAHPALKFGAQAFQGSGTLTVDLSAPMAQLVLPASYTGVSWAAITDLNNAHIGTRFTGSATNLNGLFNSGNVRYSGSATSITVKSGGAESKVLIGFTGAARTVQGASLSLPTQITATSGTTNVLLGNALTYSGSNTVSVTLTVPDGTFLDYGQGLAYSQTSPAPAATVTVTSVRSVTLTGTASQINAVLSGSTTGKITYTGTTTNLVVKATATSAEGGQVLSQGLVALYTQPFYLTTLNIPTATNPTGKLRLVVTSGDVTASSSFANFLYTTPGILSIDSASPFTLRGDTDTLPKYLRELGLYYKGTTNTTITYRVDREGSGGWSTGTSSTASITASQTVTGTQAPPAMTQLPTQIWVSDQGTVPLAFTGATLSGDTGNYTLTVSLANAPANGQGLSIVDASGTALATAVQSASLTGSLALIQALLAGTSGSVRYLGSGGTLTVSVARADNAFAVASATVDLSVSSGSANLTAQGATLTLPGTITSTSIFATNLTLPSAVSYAGSGTVKVTVSVPAGSSARLSRFDASNNPVTGQSGLTSLTLTGTATEINAVLGGTNGRVVFTPSASINQSYSLTVAATVEQPGGQSVTTQSQVTVNT
ncbi:MAG: hypothetical protein RL458_163, partial [Pseudomonadota bacterium]